MIQILKSKDVPEDFFKPRTLGSSVRDIVQGILDNVKANGEKAIFELSCKFDKACPKTLEIAKEDLENAANELKANNPEIYDALCYSRDLALAFSAEQRKCFTNFEVELRPGLFTGQKTIPVERAGIYVPAGRFPLLSSVIMGVTPAKAAGCDEVILCTPPMPHPENPDKPYADKGIMAAAYICGVDKVFAVGGAQAVAAMCYGTESIPQVQVIAGPGNKFVAEAKRIVYGEVGIDFIAGPTEVLVIADDSANPAWVAADLLAQAEHDVDAQIIMVTCSEKLAEAVSKEIDIQLQQLDTSATATQSIKNNGLIILCETYEEACKIANAKAPEHLELAFEDTAERAKLVELCRNFGSLFIGHRSAEVLGDYAAGLNHTLPTVGTAKFTGGLSVRHFLKTVTTLRTEENPDGSVKEGVKASTKAANVIGHAEGLSGHANAAFVRM